VDAIVLDEKFRFNKDHLHINEKYRVRYVSKSMQEYIDYVLIPEGLINNRVEKLAK